MSRAEISVRRCYGTSCGGLALWIVRDSIHDALYIDAATPAEARAEARRRWKRIEEERVERATRRERERNAGVEDWPELAAAMWEVLLHG